MYLLREDGALLHTLDPLVGGHLEQLLVVVVPRLVDRVVNPVFAPVDPEHLPPRKKKQHKQAQASALISWGGIQRSCLWASRRKRLSRSNTSTTHSLSVERMSALVYVHTKPNRGLNIFPTKRERGLPVQTLVELAR